MINNKSINPDWYIDKNSDPSKDLFYVYNNILSDYFKQNNYDILVLTGLSQTPCENLFLL